MDSKFSYTNRDIEAARKEGMAQIPIISQGEWSDLNPSDPGIIILDYVHALVDMIQFYQDHQALESYMETATERRNILKLARQYSYKARASSGASVDLEFYSQFPLDNNLKIPRGTKVAANLKEKTVTFLTTEDAYLFAGQTSVTATAREGERLTKTYQGTGISEFSQSQDPRNQYVVLEDPTIDMSSIYITDDSGFVWSEIDFIFYSDKDERRYELMLTEDNFIIIKFGNGQRGRIPATTDLLTISYVKTVAELGNIGAGKINAISSELKDEYDNIVSISVRNNLPSSGGSKPQSNDDIRKQAPLVLKTLWRAVTPEDFEVLAREVPGVESVKALDIKNSPDMCLHHEVKLMIVPQGGGAPSKELKSQVFDYLYPRTIPPTVLQLIDPVYVDVSFNFRVTSDKRYMEEEVRYNVQQKLNEFFESISNVFGQSIRYTTLISLISSVDGVSFIDSFSLKEDIKLTKIQMARLGEVTFEVVKEV